MKTVVWNWKTQYATYHQDNIFDCMIAEFLLSMGRSISSLEMVLKKYNVETIEALAEKQIGIFEESPKLYELFTMIEMPLVSVLWNMEHTGIALDSHRLKKVGEEIDTAILTVEKQLKDEVGFEINLNSSIQIGDYLADKQGVPLKKTKTGRYATNENEIAQYAEQFPFIQKLLSYRELSKLRSTYVDSLISKVDASGRIHTTYSQVAANTGRLSSSNPNLQNIPVTSDFGQKIKSCFIAKEGHVLISFDYSQQELRILAHLSNEEKLIEAFKANRDVHATTASQLFSVDYDKVTKEQRMIAKTINFGIIYGMSSYGMSAQLHIPVDVAQKFIDTFYATYPNIQKYYDQFLGQGRIDGFVETILGRKRYVFEYSGQKFIDNAMRRVLINYPIQGSAADLMKKAMIQIQKEVITAKTDSKLLLQIHDDLVFEVPDEKEKITTFVSTIKHIMCHVYPLAVPIEVDVKIGKNWGKMEKI